VADITESELDEVLATHPELLERLRTGDSDAFSELLEMLAGPGGDVTVHLQYTGITGMDALARLGLHRHDPDDPNTDPAAVDASRRFVASAPRRPALAKVLPRPPWSSGRAITREEFAAKYLNDLDD
jgi:hypothetical protein